ncbi:MAG TPA: SDR family oxidoreductase [Abditibacteriaceae bacterium]|jgi:NAD(P)-dependent dehydrogenase (short-subunit alcohol dehydrogenase family)
MTKTVLITGSSTGFGHATAKRFADAGWNVVATMRDTSGATDLSNRDNVLVTYLDVTDPVSIDNALKAGLSHFGKLDVLINNAGYGQYGIFESIPARKIQRNYDVNVFGVMNVTRAVIPIFREQHEGLILNVSSMGGFFGLPVSSIYISTKFALEGFTESLSYELASQNIVVKIVEPGGGDTAFHARAAKTSTDDPRLKSYDSFLAQTEAFFGELIKGIVPPEKIADVIYGAVTDGSKRLRYMAGDDVKRFVDARRSLSDEDYENYMRAQVAG